jgi:hypothetical protein
MNTLILTYEASLSFKYTGLENTHHLYYKLEGSNITIKYDLKFSVIDSVVDHEKVHIEMLAKEGTRVNERWYTLPIGKARLLWSDLQKFNNFRASRWT